MDRGRATTVQDREGGIMRQDCPRCQATMMRWYMDNVGWVSLCPFLHVIVWEHEFTTYTLALHAAMDDMQRRLAKSRDEGMEGITHSE